MPDAAGSIGRQPASQRPPFLNPPLTALAVVLGMVIFTVDLLTPIGVALPMLYPGIVLLGLWSPYPRFALIAAATATVFSLLDFYFSPFVGVVWIGIVNRLMAVTIIWVSAIIVMRYKRAEQATKILRGLLPICAWCKRIRDDSGYWKRLEEYMEQHTEAQFTHGVCAECLTKLDPDAPSRGAAEQDVQK